MNVNKSSSVRATLSLAVLLALLVANAFIGYSMTRQLRNNSASVIHTHDVMDALSRIRSNMAEVQTGQRGYTITGLAAFLEPYQNAKFRIQGELDRLAHLIRDNPQQLGDLEAVKSLIAEYLSINDKTVQVRGEEGFERAQVRVAAGEGQRAMAAIFDKLTKMYSEEQRLLTARAATEQRSYWIAVITETLAALAAIALALATAYFYWRDVRSRERARAELHEQKEWFRTTLASIGDAVIVTGASGRISFINDVAKTLTGWAANVAVGQRMTEVFQIVNEATRQPVEDPVAKVLESGAIAALANHTVLIARDGKEHSIDDSAAPIRGTDGSIIGVVLVFRDVSEQKVAHAALIASERQLRLIADIAPVYLARVDRQGRYLFVNKGYAERFNLDRDAVVGMRIPDVVGEEAYATFKPYVDRAMAGEIVEFEIDIPYQTVGTRYMHAAYMPERDNDNQVCGLVAVISDITQRKRAEIQLQQADRRKDEFLAMLGHELRNPLAPIRAAVEIMGRLGRPEPNVDKARAIIERQVAHLTRLVGDLLDVSRITHGKVTLQMQTIELAPVIMHALETARPLIDERAQSLIVNIPPDPLYVKGDAVRLAQVFGNVLTNAAKYTQDGGRIELNVEPGMETVKIRVRDNGAGISAELLPHVFDLFTQAERSVDRIQGGLGIGLTLVRRLLELQGGTICARSEGLGTGSEFSIELPLSLASEVVAPTEGEFNTATSERHLRILVVDDNIDSAESLAILLESNGDELQVAHDGPSAMIMAKSFLPDVVLLDIGLPGLSGYQVAAQLRASRETQHAVLVALTGYGQPEDQRRAFEAGFNYHLIKPVELDELEKIIASVKRQGAPFVYISSATVA